MRDSGERTVLSVSGPDAEEFLQDLVTNDLHKRGGGLVYAALLTPQGKYLADFMISGSADSLLLDVAAPLADGLAQRLAMYRLRRRVEIAPAGVSVRRGTGTPPPGALADPRHPALGWRVYGSEGGDDGTDWDALRVAHLVPESGLELIPNDTFALEAGLDRLNGIDFRKGCYVGQEVTARMKHKTELKKGLGRVQIRGEAPFGADITAEGKPAGTLFTRSGDRALAFLRFDRATGEMRADDAVLRRDA